VCDVVEERAKEGAERYGVPAYLDADEMLEKEEIDIVDVPTNEKFRYELVMKCFQRDKHVFTEKPLAGELGQFRIQLSDVPKAREMIDEWQRHDVQFGICFGLHGSANVRWAKDVIRSGRLGPLKMIDARTALGSWNHIIDLVRYLGGEVAEVFAYSDDREKMSTKTACLRFEGGQVATLAVCHKLSLQFQIKVVGELGEVTIDNIAGTAHCRLHSSLEVTRWNDESLLDPCTYYRIYENLFADYLASIRDGAPFDADGWAALRHMEIDGAITESIQTGKPVPIERYLPEKGHTIWG